MRSRLGLVVAVMFVLALPLAALTELMLGGHAESTLHVVWGIAFALLGLAVFDFSTPRWLAWVGSLSAGALAVIFLLQGISQLIDHDVLHRIAFQILGQWPEHVLVDLLIAWFVGLLLTDSHGRTRMLGWVVTALVVGTEALGVASSLWGTSIFVTEPAVRLVLLLPFVWLLFESAKRHDAGVRPGR